VLYVTSVEEATRGSSLGLRRGLNTCWWKAFDACLILGTTWYLCMLQDAWCLLDACLILGTWYLYMLGIYVLGTWYLYLVLGTYAWCLMLDTCLVLGTYTYIEPTPAGTKDEASAEGIVVWDTLPSTALYITAVNYWTAMQLIQKSPERQVRSHPATAEHPCHKLYITWQLPADWTAFGTDQGWAVINRLQLDEATRAPRLTSHQIERYLQDLLTTRNDRTSVDCSKICIICNFDDRSIPSMTHACTTERDKLHSNIFTYVILTWLTHTTTPSLSIKTCMCVASCFGFKNR
jgi:hypothetical protein